MIASLLLALTLTIQGNAYPRAMQITEFERETDTVVCEDATGLIWAFYGIEDWEIGDLVIATLDDNGTPNRMGDDIIVDVRYSGYTFPLYKYGMFDKISD